MTAYNPAAAWPFEKTIFIESKPVSSCVSFFAEYKAESISITDRAEPIWDDWAEEVIFRAVIFANGITLLAR
jgi:hypothetical protein